FNFLIVYPLLFLAYYAIPAKYSETRNFYLLLVSYLLYMNFNAAYAIILLGITVVTYLSAKMTGSTEKSIGEGGKIKLLTGVVISIIPLLVFKYYNFICESAIAMLQMVGMRHELPGLNWAVPVGISFFTFQALGYLWDVWYGRIKPEKNFLHYALFVSFFPSIVSGPINKASLVLPQIKSIRPYFDYSKAVEGLKLLLWGMFMKVVVADRVALYVDTVFSHYENYSGLSCFVASLLYTTQIYADFAGYSLMAIGVGKTLGFELTENFRRPYLAYSITDFWRRWHISLSTWLKDYVYIPLGGSRCSKLRNYWNIIVTFLVSGIWHGANWTFVIWGLWHGLFQVVEKAIGQQKCKYGTWGKSVKILITFLLVNFAWIFFRMPTIGDAFSVIARIFNPALFGNLYTPEKANTLFIVMGVIIIMVKDLTDEYCPRSFKLMESDKVWVRWMTYVLCIVMIMLTGVFDAGQFIYANF
ncbi:MAG: MBOAT family protein, partial [Prevotella sp.]|nr:MBOAT family protein [Prevotella sp.]